MPTPDIWQLQVGQKDGMWEKKQPEGEEHPVPRSQHAACRMDEKNVFVFGGHASPTQRLNDCWILTQ